MIMNYFTAKEVAEKWMVSSRMVAYYCESGRIDGAVKKGKTWFVPVDAEKPIDKRCSRRIVKAKDNQTVQDTLDIRDEETAVYHTKDIFKNLGLTRETLRYYEEIGLISPKRGQYSKYREFDLYDMSRLMSIDFYKKRGFSTIEIKTLLDAEPKEYSEVIERQICSLQTQIEHLSKMQKRLKETQDFYKYFSEKTGNFEIREFPLYYVAERFPSVASINEYRDKVLRFLNLEDEDILSNMVRALSFDETGYKSSEMYVVKLAEKIGNQKHMVYLEHGKCLYTTLLADNSDASILEKMFSACHEWAEQNQEKFCGIVYIFIRMAMLSGQGDKHFYEIWVPLK